MTTQIHRKIADRETAETRRVFSGIQPSGEVQLGNYLGAIKGWVERQEEKVNFFCLVDLHAITVYQGPEELRNQTRSPRRRFFSPPACTLTRAPSLCRVMLRHTRSPCWVLNCVTPMGLAGTHDTVQGQVFAAGERLRRAV